MQAGNTDFIYKNDLDKACFEHDIAYGKFKDLAKRAQSDKVLRDKVFEIASNPKYDGYQRGIASMTYNFFDEKSIVSGINNDVKQNQELANELHKLIIRKFRKSKGYSSFRDNIQGVDLADMEVIIKYNKGTGFLLQAIDLFSKYAWIVPLKDKKGVSIFNAKHFRQSKKNKKKKQVKYGLIDAVNLEILSLKSF